MTFGKKSPKLNSRLVYCSQLYGICRNKCKDSLGVLIWAGLFSTIFTESLIEPRIGHFESDSGWKMVIFPLGPLANFRRTRK